MVQHGSDAVADDTVRPFCNPILLWCGSCGPLAFNPSLLSVLCELIAHILSTFVVSQGLELLTRLLLCMGHIHLDAAEGFLLLLHDIPATEAAFVISEGYPVLEAAIGAWNGAMKISVDEFEEFSSSILGVREGEALLLARYAVLA